MLGTALILVLPASFVKWEYRLLWWRPFCPSDIILSHTLTPSCLQQSAAAVLLLDIVWSWPNWVSRHLAVDPKLSSNLLLSTPSWAKLLSQAPEPSSWAKLLWPSASFCYLLVLPATSCQIDVFLQYKVTTLKERKRQEALLPHTFFSSPLSPCHHHQANFKSIFVFSSPSKSPPLLCYPIWKWVFIFIMLHVSLTYTFLANLCSCSVQCTVRTLDCPSMSPNYVIVPARYR